MRVEPSDSSSVHRNEKTTMNPLNAPRPGLVGAPSTLDRPCHPDLGLRATAVESFFSKMSRQHIRRGVFRSIADLQAAINGYLTEHNASPKPFV